MPDLDTREWLVTNGLGSFASGTISDVRTRTYHGWLFAATNPPSGRTLLFSHLEASLEVSGRLIALGTNFWGNGQISPQGYKFLHSFDINPVPKWIWQQDNWQLSRQLLMPYGLGSGEQNICSHRLLIQYRYEGSDTAILRLRLLIGDRDFHHQQKGHPGLEFSQLLAQNQVCLQAIFSGEFGTPWHLRWTQGEYQADGVWYWDYQLPEEKERGLGDREDLYSPGYLTVILQPGDAVTLEAQTGLPNREQSLLTPEIFAQAIETEQERLAQIFGWGENKPFTSPIWQKLLTASDQFIVYRASISGPTVIAGYHWFNDWGRDTLIALPGLALVTQRYELAKGLLQTFGRYCRHGLIPNVFPDVDGEPAYNSIDAALWWIETLGLYLEATQDWEFLAAQFPVVQQIHKAFMGGTHYNIQVDATDGLVSWDVRGVALTWMDVVIEGEPVTPRNGKAVEINALWYSALCWMSQWAERLSQMELGDSARLAKQAQRYTQQAQQVRNSLQKFWNPQLGYLYDTIYPDDSRNSQIRPNAVLALSLHHCGFSEQQRRAVVDLATSRLLTPYGLRSLDPADTDYISKYTGDSEQRDRSYHQGTVWAWLIGPFVRAWQRSYPKRSLPFDWQPLLDHFLADGCINSISEIFDGDSPHAPKGAIAQAWSVSEVIRHFQ
ncbi:glycogen debranching enzyme N-terminal domain-containing protein [Nodularia spumigena CS-584]|jgi:predicted glycogen debranching enzyme|uniref:amylo-alpha-1,6-glucosidase n=1 Tax=Nodularia spumigena TaxID=70799 RepID=UPI0000EAB93C|nr:amylo-alpha-1,6-glucosidase [Nodularia spumigena]AHJ27540.1 glycogen debranching enzyme like protein [Nodularia spumigena CCY9414]EAW46563.1 Glycogen debranching enzyme [Nodularia spumigena CCY9414]MDB9381947.1 glycogen debranching enzyme N-terminal domain-containing protein [Nodularia spumigena CS-584]MEA5555700.1 amylo-alpha-1,6-glucosidase [Nodularia spumigena CH309]